MKNGQVPPIQPVMPSNMANGMMNGQMSSNMANGMMNGQMSSNMANGQMPPVGVAGVTINPAQTVVVPRKDNASLAKTIAIVILSLVAATFIGLFVWMFVRYSEVNSDVNGQIDVAVAEAKEAQAADLEAEFAEREKEPLRDFVGPADYGQLSFRHPKTWSVYVAKDAMNGGDYEAYFNPLQVDAVDEDTINALRLSILNKSFDAVVAEYQKDMNKKDSGLTMQSVEVNGITMNRYEGKIPDTEFQGVIVIFKIRDKTAVLQTDAVNFVSDFDALLETITFNA